MVLQFISLKTGSMHPLTWEADLQLNMDLPINLLNMQADIIRLYLCLLTSTLVFQLDKLSFPSISPPPMQLMPSHLS